MNDKHKTMSWPDMTIYWIIGYDLWNITYGFNVGEGGSHPYSIRLSSSYWKHYKLFRYDKYEDVYIEQIFDWIEV